MRFYIIIPAHNEAKFLAQTLQSLTAQTLLPKKLVIVNDNSTDGTQKIIDDFSARFPFISSVQKKSDAVHEPGSKVINAFKKGFATLDSDFDIICKFDADLLFPPNYLEVISALFQNDATVGIAGGFCYIEKNGQWVLENLTNKNHVRGALKAYRKQCFDSIGGLRTAMGWDTVDELLAQFHGWTVKTDEALHVKHLKPTGASYSRQARYKQGEAFYKLRYGFWLTLVAAAKLAHRKNSIAFFIDCLRGFVRAWQDNAPAMVSAEEGVFIRRLRWKGIKEKVLG
ncbi:MAG: glycosyl transferase family 2 [Flavobacteriaceae bacterium]|nr:glycosyl transferase family 2 [Flavobacteriaceae bacterium]